MRRIIANKIVDKSTEKKQRDALIDSIAVEKQVLGTLSDEIGESTDRVESLNKEINALVSKIETYQKDINLYEKKNDKLVGEIIDSQNKLQGLDEIKKELERDLLLLRTEFNTEQLKFNKERAEFKRISERDVLESEIKKGSIRREIDSLDTRYKVLTKCVDDISKDITNKEQQCKGLDVSIAHRMKELAQINKDLSGSKSQAERASLEFSKIDSKIRELQKEIDLKDKEVREKTEEIKNKENEVEKKREELVAVMMRSRKIDEKAEAIKELFGKAGLKVDI